MPTPDFDKAVNILFDFPVESAMRLAVLLLQNSDLMRVTAYPQSWVVRLVKFTTGFLTDQSGGRKTIEFKVFDWFRLPMTGAQWSAAGMGVGPIARAQFEAALGIDLGIYTHFALVIYRPDAISAAVSTSNPCLVRLWQKEGAATLCRGWLRGVGDRSEPRARARCSA